MENQGKKVAVIGSRTIHKAPGVGKIIAAQNPVEIVGGGCMGATKIGKKYAEVFELKYVEFLPDYGRYGRIAPHVRNEEIAKYCDVMIAIWDGKSKGTKSEMEKARRKGKKVIIFRVDGV